MRQEEDLPTPPPLPANHPTQKARAQESAKLVGIFYAEFFGASIVLLVLANFLDNFLNVPQAVLIGVLLMFLLVSGRRLAKKVVEARKKRGTPRWSATLAFVGALVLPIFMIGFLLYSPAKVRGPSVMQQEAKTVLRAIAKAEIAFYKDNGTYTFNTRELPIELPNLSHYVFGFPTACTVKLGVAQTKAQWIADDPTYVQAKKTEIDSYFLNARRAEDCMDPKEAYEVYAVGVISGSQLDVWKIGNKQPLKNEQRGY